MGRAGYGTDYKILQRDYKGLCFVNPELNVHFKMLRKDKYMLEHVVISKSEYEEYCRLREKDSPKLKKRVNCRKYCPVCGYLVDDLVPPQKYCDRCGQRLCISLFEI